MHIGDDPPAPQAAAEAGQNDLAGARILLVDASADDSRLIGRFLASAGASVETIGDGVIAVQRALDRLQTDRIDLMQFHAWSYADPSYLDGLFWLQELVEEGLIHCLGLTNFDTAHLRVVLNSGIEVVSNQVCGSLLDRRAAHGMSELCRAHGVAVLAFGIAMGYLEAAVVVYLRAALDLASVGLAQVADVAAFDTFAGIEITRELRPGFPKICFWHEERRREPVGLPLDALAVAPPRHDRVLTDARV